MVWPSLFANEAIDGDRQIDDVANNWRPNHGIKQSSSKGVSHTWPVAAPSTSHRVGTGSRGRGTGQCRRGTRWSRERENQSRRYEK